MRRFRRQIQSVGVHEAFIDGAWRRCSCIWFHRQTRLQAQEWLRMEATPGALSSTTPSWEVAIGPDTHCGVIYLAQAATCRLDVVCLSAPRVLLVYGDKTERQGLTGGLLGWNKVVCQSTGWDWMEISPQGVHIDLERKLKKKKNPASAQAVSSGGTSAGAQSASSAQTENGNSHAFSVEDNHVARPQRGGKPTAFSGKDIVMSFPVSKTHFQTAPKATKEGQQSPAGVGCSMAETALRKLSPLWLEMKYLTHKFHSCWQN